jgi:hypothetical protein
MFLLPGAEELEMSKSVRLVGEWLRSWVMKTGQQACWEDSEDNQEEQFEHTHNLRKIQVKPTSGISTTYLDG